MTPPEELFMISRALKELRTELARSKLPAQKLKIAQAKALELGDECHFHIGWLCAKPDAARTAAVAREKLAEIGALIAQVAAGRNKGGRSRKTITSEMLRIDAIYQDLQNKMTKKGAADKLRKILGRKYSTKNLDRDRARIEAWYSEQSLDKNPPR